MKDDEVIYAGWDGEEADKAGTKAKIPYRLLQFFWGGRCFRIALAAPSGGKIRGTKTVSIEERFEVPTINGGEIDIYVAE